MKTPAMAQQLLTLLEPRRRPGSPQSPWGPTAGLLPKPEFHSMAGKKLFVQPAKIRAIPHVTDTFSLTEIPLTKRPCYADQRMVTVRPATFWADWKATFMNRSNSASSTPFNTEILMLKKKENKHRNETNDFKMPSFMALRKPKPKSHWQTQIGSSITWTHPQVQKKQAQPKFGDGAAVPTQLSPPRARCWCWRGLCEGWGDGRCLTKGSPA